MISIASIRMVRARESPDRGSLLRLANSAVKAGGSEWALSGHPTACSPGRAGSHNREGVFGRIKFQLSPSPEVPSDHSGKKLDIGRLDWPRWEILPFVGARSVWRTPALRAGGSEWVRSGHPTACSPGGAGSHNREGAFRRIEFQASPPSGRIIPERNLISIGLD